MNSKLTKCSLHSILQTYYCYDCSLQLCEDCVLHSHYQHTITFYQKAQENTNLINLNNKHIKWLLQKEQQTKVLEQIIQFQIDEKLNINHHLYYDNNLDLYKPQIMKSDHEHIVTQYTNRILQDQEQEESKHLYLDAQNYKFTQKTWDQLCQKLSSSPYLETLSIKLCSSTLDSAQLHQLVLSILQLNELLDLELDMQNTKINSEAIATFIQLFGLPKLIKFEASIQNSNIPISTLNEFWQQYTPFIKEKYNYFYIYHHLYSFGHNVDFEQEISVSKASIYLNDCDTVVE